MNDFRFAFRHLLKSPGFSAIAILTLALGIGLNTSMFSLMNLLLLQPIAYPDRDHLVRIFRTTPQSQNADHPAPDYLDLVRETSDFADLAAYRLWGFTLVQADRPPVNLNALRVSASFFPILGLQPELGRFFTPEEDAPGNHVIILSHAAWQTHFGGDPTVIGRTVRIDGEPTTIVGVMPAAFSSLFLWGPGDAFRPFAMSDLEKTDRADTNIRILARSHPNLALDQLNARLAALAERLARHRPRENSEDGLRAATLQSTVRNPTTAQITSLLLGLAGFVLLIACTNLANPSSPASPPAPTSLPSAPPSAPRAAACFARCSSKAFYWRSPAAPSACSSPSGPTPGCRAGSPPTASSPSRSRSTGACSPSPSASRC